MNVFMNVLLFDVLVMVVIVVVWLNDIFIGVFGCCLIYLIVVVLLVVVGVWFVV